MNAVVLDWNDVGESRRTWAKELLVDLQLGSEALDRKKREIKDFVSTAIGLLRQMNSDRQKCLFRSLGVAWEVRVLRGSTSVEAYCDGALRFGSCEPDRLELRYIEQIHVTLPILLLGLVDTFPKFSHFYEPLRIAAHNARTPDAQPLGTAL